MAKEPTQEQQLIIDHPGNTVVTAKPGSGKTYTVVEKIGKVLTSIPDFKGVIATSGILGTISIKEPKHLVGCLESSTMIYSSGCSIS